jgi:hypothetical protein
VQRGILAFDHTKGHTLGGTTLDECSAPSQRPLPVTKPSQETTSMTLEGFETAIPGSDRPQAYTLNRTVTVIGRKTSKSIWLNSIMGIYKRNKK